MHQMSTRELFMFSVVSAFIGGVGIAGFLVYAINAELKSPKTCYVTEWKQVKKNGQEWKEPVKQICVKGESE